MFKGEIESTVEAEVQDVTLHPNILGHWIVNLTAPYSHGQAGVHEVSIRVKDVPEIDDLASRAYHCHPPERFAISSEHYLDKVCIRYSCA